jgi:hypothetical protein
MSNELYNHIIVWLDQNITSSDYCRQLKKAFATTTNPSSKLLTSIDEQDISNLIRDDSLEEKERSFLEVPFLFKLFSEIEPCLTFLLKYSQKKKIFFLTSGSLGEYIVPRILTDHQEIFKDKNGKLYEDSIYIFCADMVKHGQWAIDYLDLDCIKMENDDQAILARLTRDIARYFISEGEQFIINDEILSLSKSKQYFTWAKELFNKAQLVVKTHTNNTTITKIDQLINQTEYKINQINQLTDQDKFGEEN